MFLNGLRGIAVFVALLLAGGCSLLRGGSDDPGSYYLPERAGTNAIRIESEPAGADVYAMGEKIGTTPVAISPGDVFPMTYPKEEESLYGKVALRKAGCSDVTKTVTTKVMNAGLRVHLECGNPNRPSADGSRDASDGGETAEQRLTRIKALLDKGLITEEEARRARARVLEGL